MFNITGPHLWCALPQLNPFSTIGLQAFIFVIRMTCYASGQRAVREVADASPGVLGCAGRVIGWTAGGLLLYMSGQLARCLLTMPRVGRDGLDGCCCKCVGSQLDVCLWCPGWAGWAAAKCVGSQLFACGAQGGLDGLLQNAWAASCLLVVLRGAGWLL